MPAGIQVTLNGVTADGTTVTETYGDYFGGAEGKNNDPFSMKPYLAFNRPPKQKVYLKPDVIKYTANAEPKVLYLRGLWTSFFRVDEAVKAAFPKATVADGWLDSSPVGLTLSYFPADYPALTGYDLYVLGNVPAAPLDLVGQEMLKDYLEAGGNLLLLGGDQAFGQAGFTNQGLISLLPLELGGQYNWRKLPDGSLKTAADHPVTKGVSFGAKDMVYYSHLCTPKQGATVAVKAGERPILVLTATPKGGRIACVLATPFGEAGEGQTAFWEAPAWRQLMQNTVQWLIQR
ncbi:MAG: glutamine amidotransferase [Planctomycetota bacterium]|nr:glutamine amidotransferase [Planctomycetota bacterium]